MATIGRGWKEQELITSDDIRMYLDACLSIKPHAVPKGMVGKLYTIDGQVDLCEAIMNHLERRAKLFGGYTKRQLKEGEKENDKEKD